MARFVLDAFDLPAATPEQITRVEQTLQSLELERAEAHRRSQRDATASRVPHSGGRRAAGAAADARRPLAGRRAAR